MKNLSGIVEIDILEIKTLIPHRYPFLLIDKVINCTPGEGGTGIKNVTVNEPFFEGHFPVRPVMPGVLIIEAMAQTAGVSVLKNFDEADRAGKLMYFMGIDECKFRAPVVPGDVLHLEVEKKQERLRAWKFDGKARVNGKVVATATFKAMIMDA